MVLEREIYNVLERETPILERERVLQPAGTAQKPPKPPRRAVDKLLARWGVNDGNLQIKKRLPVSKGSKMCAALWPSISFGIQKPVADGKDDFLCFYVYKVYFFSNIQFSFCVGKKFPFLHVFFTSFHL